MYIYIYTIISHHSYQIPILMIELPHSTPHLALAVAIITHCQHSALAAQQQRVVLFAGGGDEERVAGQVTWQAMGGSRNKLVGGFNHLEKYESQLGWLSMIIPYMKWKMKAMFETTKQQGLNREKVIREWLNKTDKGWEMMENTWNIMNKWCTMLNTWWTII